jgi:hypothetical protein
LQEQLQELLVVVGQQEAIPLQLPSQPPRQLQQLQHNSSGAGVVAAPAAAA